MFALTLLGMSVSVPSAERNHPGLLVETGNHMPHVDCGERPSVKASHFFGCAVASNVFDNRIALDRSRAWQRLWHAGLTTTFSALVLEVIFLLRRNPAHDTLEQPENAADPPAAIKWTHTKASFLPKCGPR